MLQWIRSIMASYSAFSLSNPVILAQQLSHFIDRHSWMTFPISVGLSWAMRDLILQVLQTASSSSQSSTRQLALTSESWLISLTSLISSSRVGSQWQRFIYRTSSSKFKWNWQSHSYRPDSQNSRICSLCCILLQIGMFPLQLQDRKKTHSKAEAANLWVDVQDEGGTWRVGFCERKEANYRVISLDGFHPAHTSFYCEHSDKVVAIRSKTMGLTVDERGTIRGAVKLKEIEQVCGKMSLFQLIANQLEHSAEKIRVFLRTELLIFIDKVFTTPIEVLFTIKLADVHINKLFILTIEYYFKLLESSKRFVTLLDSSETARELFKATYEMAQIISMVLGLHKRSKPFYDSPLNRTIRPESIMDYFVKYEGGGILPFKLFFKNMTSLKQVTKQDLLIALETVYLFISICEKYPGDFVEGKIQPLSRIILDEIINLIKQFCDRQKQVAAELKAKVELISRIETLYFKLFPSQECSLRKFIEGQGQKQNDKNTFLRELETVKTMARMKSQLNLNLHRPLKEKEKDKSNDQKLKQLEDKIAHLESSIQKLPLLSSTPQPFRPHSQEEEPPQPTENLGEEAFLGSLEWALEAGDTVYCRKLVRWRKGLLRLGRMAGWEVALAVGRRTMGSKEIAADDIIQANYDYMSRVERGPPSDKQ